MPSTSATGMRVPLTVSRSRCGRGRPNIECRSGRGAGAVGPVVPGRWGFAMTLVSDDIRVVDADTHLTEAHDLWVKRAPAAFRDRVPRVEEVAGRPTWVVDGAELGFAGGGGVIDREGEKFPFSE